MTGKGRWLAYALFYVGLAFCLWQWYVSLILNRTPSQLEYDILNWLNIAAFAMLVWMQVKADRAHRTIKLLNAAIALNREDVK